MELCMDNICRTCMKEEENMLSIFSDVEFINNKLLNDMLMQCASVKVAEGDGLPEQICQQCIKKLIVAYNFKKQSEQIDATLREITKNPNIEFIKDEQTPIEEILEAKLDKPEDKEDELQIFAIKLEDVEEENFNEEYIDENYYLEEIDENEPEEYLELEENQEDSLEEEFILVEQDELKPKYTCEICLNTFETITLLTKHKKLHENKTFNCVKCNISFRTKLELKRHRKPRSVSHICDLCTREFRSPHGLAYHKKTYHSGIKNYICTYENCKKAFALKQALEKHLSVHAKDGNHLCYLCGKMYSTYDALHYHIRTHDGVRPHLCVHCGKTFKQACHLKAHMWVHSGIKPHECKKCGKCYTSGHQLKKHLKKYCNNFEIDAS